MSTTAYGAPATQPVGARVWLRRVLFLDAGVTTANGLAYLIASGPLGRLLGVGSGLLLGLGVFLVLYGVAVGLLGSRPRPGAVPVRLVVDANLLWAVLSLAGLALWLDPGAAGLVWIPLQAVVVGGFAVLQFVALRRAALD